MRFYNVTIYSFTLFQSNGYDLEVQFLNTKALLIQIWNTKTKMDFHKFAVIYHFANSRYICNLDDYLNHFMDAVPYPLAVTLITSSSELKTKCIVFSSQIGSFTHLKVSKTNQGIDMLSDNACLIYLFNVTIKVTQKNAIFTIYKSTYL